MKAYKTNDGVGGGGGKKTQQHGRTPGFGTGHWQILDILGRARKRGLTYGGHAIRGRRSPNMNVSERSKVFFWGKEKVSKNDNRK